MIVFQSGGFWKFPKFGLISPDRTFSVVLLPIPFWPSRPSTVPGEGMGKRKSLNALAPNLWLQSFSNSSGRFTILIALNGHFLTHIPQPLQSFSLIMILFSSKRMASTLLRTIGQYFMHIWLHFFGLHLSYSITAMRVMGNRIWKEKGWL